MPASSRWAWFWVIAACTSVWLLARVAFFVGMAGSDDMYHTRYAALWDHAPVNHWEARLLANALIGISMNLFGRNELAAVLPSVLSSLGVLFCVLLFCGRVCGVRQALWAGLLVALLPLEVESATFASAVTVMKVFLTIGTVAFALSATSHWARWLAAVCLALGVITHLSGAYYVAALVLASLLVDRRHYLRPAVATLAVTALAVAAEMAVFHFVFDNMMGRFQASVASVMTETPVACRLIVDGQLNWSFLAWPVQNMLLSRGFGVTLGLAFATALCHYRGMSLPLRLLVLAAGLHWLWMSYGTQVPWDYRPFWRLMRFLHPLTLVVAVLFGMAMAGKRWLLLRAGVGGTALAACLAIMLGSGSWSQNVEVSRELLTYARLHPDRLFITDYHTLNEMYVLHGMEPIANVVTIADGTVGRLLDPSAKRMAEGEAPPPTAVLDNPLNTARTPAFAALMHERTGRLIHQTTPTYRRVCRFVPMLRSRPWAVRKPPARVFEYVAGSTPSRTQPGEAYNNLVANTE